MREVSAAHWDDVGAPHHEKSGTFPSMTRRLLFLLGMATCVVAAVLMVVGVVTVPWGSALGLLGVGLLGTAASRPAGDT